MLLSYLMVFNENVGIATRNAPETLFSRSTLKPLPHTREGSPLPRIRRDAPKEPPPLPPRDLAQRTAEGVRIHQIA